MKNKFSKKIALIKISRMQKEKKTLMAIRLEEAIQKYIEGKKK